MAATGGPGDPDVERLTAELFERPWEFEFFQAVDLLARLCPDRAPVGGFAQPSREAVRFAVRPSLAFAASDIHALERQDEAPPRMQVDFMGLTGPTGVLPLVYTALLLERAAAGDRTLADFLDLFHHRTVALFQRAWEKYRFTVSAARGEPDRVAGLMLDLIGAGTPGLRDRQAIDDSWMLHYCGLLAQRPRSASALRQILEDYFEVPVEIVQFAGRWHKLEESAQCRLEDARRPSEQLGLGAVAGDEFWDQQSVVRIRLGPLPLERYLDFLPTGGAYRPLCAIARFFAGDEIDFEAQLVLRRDDAPRCELGAGGAAGPQLGWVCWMRSAPLGYDPDQTVLQLNPDLAARS
jgi:type VI secretion system protein ImpH